MRKVVVMALLVLTSCSDNQVAPSDPDALAEFEDRAIGPVLDRLREMQGQVPGGYWFVEARLTVDSPDGPLLNRSVSYRPRDFSEEVRAQISQRGYQFCSIIGDAVCPDVWQNVPATMVSMGTKIEAEPGCPNPLWVAYLRVDPSDPLGTPYHSRTYVMCVKGGDEPQVTDVKTYWIEN